MKTVAVLSGYGLYSCGFSSANVFVAVFLSKFLDHHSYIVFFLVLFLFFFLFCFFLADKNMDGNKERDKKQSALLKELQEKFMTTDSAVLQTKKLNSGEHYTDLDSVNFT